MSIGAHDRYHQPMTQFEAIMIAEGNEEATYDGQVEAWQYLVDTGLAWRLQGWFGRQAARMIEDGVITPAGR